LTVAIVINSIGPFVHARIYISVGIIAIEIVGHVARRCSAALNGLQRISISIAIGIHIVRYRTVELDRQRIALHDALRYARLCGSEYAGDHIAARQCTVGITWAIGAHVQSVFLPLIHRPYSTVGSVGGERYCGARTQGRAGIAANGNGWCYHRRYSHGDSVAQYRSWRSARSIAGQIACTSVTLTVAVFVPKFTPLRRH
jgi:hypothetical protein